MKQILYLAFLVLVAGNTGCQQTPANVRSETYTLSGDTLKARAEK